MTTLLTVAFILNSLIYAYSIKHPMYLASMDEELYARIKDLSFRFDEEGKLQAYSEDDLYELEHEKYSTQVYVEYGVLFCAIFCGLLLIYLNLH